MPAKKKVTGGGTPKKNKGTKKWRRRGSFQLEDVPVKTSLPPKVDGQLRCHLRVSVTQILWNVGNAPDYTQVRLIWWGEEGNGAIFRPVDVKRGEKKGPMHNTIARYPVRCGMRQLASYFTDMGNVTLDILSGRHSIVVGRAQVEGLSALKPNQPINGFFPIFSADDEKVGELQVTIILEPLIATDDSMSSVPTPDMSLQMRESFSEAQPINQPHIVPTPAPPPIYSTIEDPFRSPTANRTRTTPQGVDSMIFNRPVNRVNDSGFSYPSTGPSFPQSSAEEARPSAIHSLETLKGSGAAAAGGSQFNLNTELSSGGFTGVDREQAYATLADMTKKVEKDLRSTFSSGGSNLVSELLERGEKLRKAMIVSTIQPTPTNKRPIITDTATTPSRVVTSLDFSKHLTGDSGPTSYISGSHIPNDLPDNNEHYKIGGGLGSVGVGIRAGYNPLGLSVDTDIGPDTISMVLGDDGDIEQSQLMNTMGSPTSSVSDLEVNSDMDDPIHDDDILAELFYKNPDTEDSDISLSDCEAEKPNKYQGCSDSNVSLHEPGNKRPPSRGSRCSSSSSLHLDMEPTRDVEPDHHITPQKKKNRKHRRKKGAISADSTDQSENELNNTSLISSTRDDSRFDSSLNSGRSCVDGLSVERLTLLGRVHVARVVIDNLALSLSQQTIPTETKGGGKHGKPPRPVKKAGTYFVEYQFPVVATAPSAVATEVMRVASKKVTDGLVSFGHRSVFPVVFDGEVINKWWKSALVFKVYNRSSNQKVPTMLGMCSVPLKSVLKSEALYLEQQLEIMDRSNTSTSKTSRSSRHLLVGLIKLTIELASDSKDFAKALARTRLAEMTNAKIVALPQAPLAQSSHAPPDPLKRQSEARSTSETQTEPQHTNLDEVPSDMPLSSIKGIPPTTGYQTHGSTAITCDKFVEPSELPILHTYLSIPEGENITFHGVKYTQHGETLTQIPKSFTDCQGHDMRARNLYLVCRMFWLDDAVRSNICWGTIDPEFKFNQVTPVLLSAPLLERLRNNFVIVEVWDKKASESDQIVGIVKLPLHQFYMSYRHKQIATTLLNSQYPVISVDTAMPILNPFTGATHGKIKVLLAMGSHEQVCHLQHLKEDGQPDAKPPERPLEYRERKDLLVDPCQNQAPDSGVENIEHMFEVCVEGVRGLKLMDTMMWGEADCYIQYHFPSQAQTQTNQGPALVHGLSLRAFRTATTLCVPDPVFNNVTKHQIMMPERIPVQRELLAACAGVGSGPGGVPFEVWFRYYHPNTRDQLVAKGTLPLAKLCAMVTMKQKGEVSTQTFTLPLTHIGDEDVGSGITGHIDVIINYYTYLTKSEVPQPTEVCEETEEQPATRSPIKDRSLSITIKSPIKERPLSPTIRSPVRVTSPMTIQVLDTFRVHISVERAYHLAHVKDRNTGLEVPPNSYVSYQSADQEGPLYTCLVEGNDSPMWCYEHDTILEKSVLTQENKNLVFKAWHKPMGPSREPDKSTDKVLGFVSVDLAPLTSGFSQIAGWYNIIDFHGLCQGQIKISVTPLDAVCDEVQSVGLPQSSVLGGPGFAMPSVSSQLGVSNLDPESQGVLARFSQHYENVKNFHESLAASIHGLSRPVQKSTDDEIPPQSRSTLFRSLRSNIAELDTLTNKLKKRLEPNSSINPPPIPSQPNIASNDTFNDKPQSHCTDAETSALTNSQHLLPLPNDIPTSSNDEMYHNPKEDPRTSTARAQGKQATSLLNFVHTNVGGIWIEKHHVQDKEYPEADPRGGIRSAMALFDTYGSEQHIQHGDSDEDYVGGGLGYGDDEDNLDNDQMLVIPRPINDVSNVNFNNMAPLGQGQNTTQDEEASWCVPLSPKAQQHHEEFLPSSDEAKAHDEQEFEIDLGGTASTFGVTGTSLGTMEGVSAYDHILMGDNFNNTSEPDPNFEDSWATSDPYVIREYGSGIINERKNEVGERAQECDEDEKILEESLHGIPQLTTNQEEEVDSEKSLEDPYSLLIHPPVISLNKEVDSELENSIEADLTSEEEGTYSLSEGSRAYRLGSSGSYKSADTSQPQSDWDKGVMEENNNSRLLEHMDDLTLNDHNDITVESSTLQEPVTDTGNETTKWDMNDTPALSDHTHDLSQVSEFGQGERKTDGASETKERRERMMRRVLYEANSWSDCEATHVDTGLDLLNFTARFMGSSSARTRPLPGSQHTERIAKIFSSKYTNK